VEDEVLSSVAARLARLDKDLSPAVLIGFEN
jgi:hypothetical protein